MIFWLGREVIGVVVAILANVDYQIVRVNGGNIPCKILFLADLLRSNVVTLIFLVSCFGIPFLDDLAMLRLRNGVNLELGVVEVLGGV